MADLKHDHTNELYIYWNRIRGRRTAPERSSIEPADIRGILKDTFILKVEDIDTYSFRLAGTRTCSILGRELKENNVLNLFEKESSEAVQTLFHSACQDSTVSVLGLIGKNKAGQSMPLEMLILPLRLNGKTDARIIGSIVPLKVPYWAGMEPIDKLHLASLRMIMPHQHKNEISRPLVTEDETHNVVPFTVKGARRVKHLQVLDGGSQT
ncbi:MAG: PAS domain-containing protein [Hyphomicrobiales bacterium]